MAELDTSKQDGKKGKKHKVKKASTRVDLTPMVDLGFLLVTFFMLTTTFSKPQTMEINMPIKDDTVKPEEQQAIKQSHAMIVVLGKDNEIYYYMGNDMANPVKTDFSVAGIRKELTGKVSEVGEGLMVLVKPTKEATYRNVVDMLDELNITKVKRYAIVDVDANDMQIVEKKFGKI